MPVCIQSCRFLYVRGVPFLAELSHYRLSKPNWTSSWRQLLGIPLLTLVTAVHAVQFSSICTFTTFWMYFFFDIKFMYCCHASLPLKGFTTLALLSYSNLEKSADGFFSGMKPKPDQNFGINSKITTITVSNNDTRQLSEPVTLTIHHLKPVTSCLLWAFCTCRSALSRFKVILFTDKPIEPHLCVLGFLWGRRDVVSPRLQHRGLKLWIHGVLLQPPEQLCCTHVALWNGG